MKELLTNRKLNTLSTKKPGHAPRLLPCRHVFYLRKALDMETVIPTQLLPSRWLLSSVRTEVPLEDIPGKAFSIGKVLDDEDKPWNANRKFREANYVGR
ncbi:hypothetical protein PHMEG_00037534 [Phytophthora megakarya]|uniref:Uncharacterized protein n=1 Tax=Phytophthora megakarya TaxID=4795 RepID=A0A225UJR0_9STRA|nr:hypothetical protein PHMEG_00037534 [Phytophthora megakarya]